MKRGAAAAIIVAAGAIGLGGAIAFQNESAPNPVQETETPSPDADNASAPASEPQAKKPSAPPAIKKVTPMNQRVAVLGLLNKRNGLWRDLKMRPGQAVKVGDVIVRLRACETTAPWEDQKLTGAFVQTDVRGVDGKWRRAFSGWLYKESPSLNVVEHPIYDVWPKSCAMTHPGGEPARPANSRSSAPNSTAAATPGAAPAAPSAAPSAPPPSAEANSAR